MPECSDSERKMLDNIRRADVVLTQRRWDELTKRASDSEAA